ncbi:hypothetical protein AURDEDRAFT_187777 [Auricularia subglabra TFB-10046 SS5]|nr:hypothetical protein AURDEDRAFT_187777 [Auricularia subglabra TFB-10046 SS5]
MSSEERRLIDPVGYCQMVAIAWFVHDYLLTFADEARRVCLGEPSLSRSSTSTRYLAFALLISSVAVYAAEGIDRTVSMRNLACVLPFTSPQGCKIFDRISAAGTFVLVILVDIILQFRIYVMYGGNRRILYINGGLFILAIIGAIVSAFLFFPTAVQAPANAEGSCYSWRSPELSTVWATPLAFDVYLACLAVIRYSKDMKRYSGRNVNLLRIITMDNVAYFVLMTVAIAVVFSIWLFVKARDVTPAAASVSLIHAAGAVGGSRLIINIRKAILLQDDVVQSPLDAPSVHSHAMVHLRELRASVQPSVSSRDFRASSSELVGLAQ